MAKPGHKLGLKLALYLQLVLENVSLFFNLFCSLKFKECTKRHGKKILNDTFANPNLTRILTLMLFRINYMFFLSYTKT